MGEGASSRRLVFPYRPLGGAFAPMVTVGFKIGGVWRITELYLDSGAYYTILHAGFAQSASLDFRKGVRKDVQVGDGNMIPIYLHRLPVQLASESFEATVAFSEKLGVRFNLLGRFDIFERFKITFQENRKIVFFEREQKMIAQKKRQKP
ncbi:MAG: hypothetical protein HY360_15675 [Verrucomicrobia bacterium]|nr:hypothetical protein [Verrucomicrobiota bacterium]